MPCLQIPLFKLPNLLLIYLYLLVLTTCGHLRFPQYGQLVAMVACLWGWLYRCGGFNILGLWLFQCLIVLVMLLWGWLHRFGISNIFRLRRFQCLVTLITHGHCGTHLWSNSLYSAEKRKKKILQL